MTDQPHDEIRAALTGLYDKGLNEVRARGVEHAAARARRRSGTRLAAVATVVAVLLVGGMLGFRQFGGAAPAAPGSSGVGQIPTAAPTPAMDSLPYDLSATGAAELRLSLINGGGPLAAALPITVTNKRDTPVHGFRLRVTVADTNSTVGTNAPGVACTASRSTWDCSVAGSLAAGASVTITFQLTVMHSFTGTIPVTTHAFRPGPDPTPDNDVTTQLRYHDDAPDLAPVEMSVHGPTQLALTAKDGGYEGRIRLTLRGNGKADPSYQAMLALAAPLIQYHISTVSGPIVWDDRCTSEVVDLSCYAASNLVVTNGDVQVEFQFRSIDRNLSELKFSLLAVGSDRNPPETNKTDNDLTIALTYP